MRVDGGRGSRAGAYGSPAGAYGSSAGGPPRWRRLARLAGLALAVATGVLASAACGDAGGSDTAEVGADLLRSRQTTGSRAPLSERPPGPRERAAEAPTEEPDLEALGWQVGDTAAPVRVLEFSDFGCGYCRQFHVDTWPALREEYVETGKVLWKFVPMELGMFGPNSENAALAAECALEQDRFPAMAERLFADQGTWKRAGEPRSAFRGYASEGGLDVGRWERCMDAGDRRARVKAGTNASRMLGVRGTPTFFILGYGGVPGALPLDTFRQLLDEVYRRESGEAG